jgi:hypothetical protein
MGIFGAIVCLAFFFLVLFDFCQRLPAGQRPKFNRWFLFWAIKGLLVPTLLWVLFDAGIFDCLPTFTPEIQFANVAGHRFQTMCDVATMGLFIIGSYWAAVTSAWLLTALAQRTEHRREFKHCVLLWSAFLAPLAVLLTRSFGWRFAGLGATLWLLPIVQRVLSLQPEQIVRPVYSQAIAKLHFDKHEEAEKAVLEELEKCEDDFDGWLLLADLYANHFKDLAGAEDIIRQTCDHPHTTASQVAVAFHRLADWHLKLADDPAAARRDLWEICRRHPKSHLDRMARMRIDQIPGSKEEFVERQTPKTISLPARSDGTSGFATTTLARKDALTRAKHCVERLKKDPNDIALREDLARIFAEQLDAVDPGLEQLELLLAMPNPPENKVAQWLSLMAAWQLQYKHDQPAARKLLERVVSLYPKTPPAFAAQSQIGLMDAEARMRAICSNLNPPKI